MTSTKPPPKFARLRRPYTNGTRSVIIVGPDTTGSALEDLCGVEHLKINLLIEEGRKLKRQYIFQLCCHMLTPAQSK